jgi:hypothetical protein
MFKHLLPERGVLLDESATVPRHELEVDEDRVGFVLLMPCCLTASLIRRDAAAKPAWSCSMRVGSTRTRP